MILLSSCVPYFHAYKIDHPLRNISGMLWSFWYVAPKAVHDINPYVSAYFFCKRLLGASLSFVQCVSVAITASHHHSHTVNPSRRHKYCSSPPVVPNPGTSDTYRHKPIQKNTSLSTSGLPCYLKAYYNLQFLYRIEPTVVLSSDPSLLTLRDIESPHVLHYHKSHLISLPPYSWQALLHNFSTLAFPFRCFCKACNAFSQTIFH